MLTRYTEPAEQRPLPRHLPAWLAFAMLCVPALFVWFLLGRDYSRQLRIAGFTYAAVMLLVGILGKIGS